MLRRLTFLLTAATIAVAGLSAAAPAVAVADSFNCDATALQATLLTAPPVALGTANLGAPNCQNASGTAVSIPSSLALPVSATVLQAQTTVTANGGQATAVGGLAGLGVGLGNTALGQLTGTISQQLTSALQQIPIGAVPLNPSSIPGYSALVAELNLIAPQVVGPLNQALTVGGAVIQQALITTVQQTLPSLLANALNGNLLGLQVADSIAGATCVNGQPQLAGTSQVAGLTVLGQSIPLDGSAIPLITLLNTSQLGQADIGQTLTQLATGVTQAIDAALGPAATNPLVSGLLSTLVGNVGGAVDSTVQPVLTQVLAQLAPVLGQLVSLQVQPNRQILANGQLTQQALHVSLAIAGQAILDVLLGQARVSNASVSCATAAAAAAAQLALQCTTRKLTLIDVFERRGHVDLLGAADKRFVGRHVAITFLATHQRVATALVGPDGFFRTTASLPSRAVRATNLARYQARIGGERSLNLKLERRMVVQSISSRAGLVTISGRVVPPLTRPPAAISVQRRVSCTDSVGVTTIRPRPDGSWKAVVAAPPGQQAAVYRLQTVVLKRRSNPKRFPTFTLPRVVELG